MNITAKHVSRYQQIVRLLWKYGRSDLVKQLGVDEDHKLNAYDLRP